MIHRYPPGLPSSGRAMRCLILMADIGSVAGGWVSSRFMSRLFPRGMAGSVIGIGGLSGALGGMLMAKVAGTILETVGSYQPIFMVAAGAYLFALLILHFIVPRYALVAPFS